MAIVCTNPALRAKHTYPLSNVPDGSYSTTSSSLPKTGLTIPNEPIFSGDTTFFYSSIWLRQFRQAIYSSAIAGANDVCEVGQAAHEK